MSSGKRNDMNYQEAEAFLRLEQWKTAGEIVAEVSHTGKSNQLLLKVKEGTQREEHGKEGYSQSCSSFPISAPIRNT